MEPTRVPRRVFLGAVGGAVAAGVGAPRFGARWQAPRPMKDVVVLLPGITGSVLRRNGVDVWAPSLQGVLGALLSLGRSLNTLRLSDDPPDRDDLGDGVTADRLVADVHLVPGFWKIDGYSSVRRRIQQFVDVKPGANYFEFPYDWRRDNRVAARKLGVQARGWLENWRKRSGNKDAKLVLVGHSMGGLVSRYFLECLDGWRDTRRLITFGTPYWGSLNALDMLSNGLKKAIGPVVIADLTMLLRSFTSVYQLLPVYPCYDSGGGELAVPGQATGIPNVDPAKATGALAFHREIDARVDEHVKESAYLENRYRIHAVAGIFQPTSQVARLQAARLVMARQYPGKDYDGDGTVPRPSAKPRGYDRDPFYVVEKHGSLQNSDAALGQLAGVLTGDEFEPAWGPGALSLSLTVEDSYAVGEPVEILVGQQPADLALTLTARIVEVGSKEPRTRKMERTGPGRYRTVFSKLPAGTYRVTVWTGGDSVSDLFLVA